MKSTHVMFSVAFTALFFVFTNGFPQGATKESTPETIFFHQNLTDAERVWFMNSSLILHLEQTEPSTKPVPGVSGRALEIPASLMPKLLNGGVPQDFQARFTNWVMTTYGLTNEHLKALVNGQEACGQYDCIQIPSLGGTCCPFG